MKYEPIREKRRGKRIQAKGIQELAKERKRAVEIEESVVTKHE